MLLFNIEKQKEITELLQEAGKNHCSSIRAYKVEFFETGENTSTNFIMIDPVTGENIIHIQNIMSKDGMEYLNSQKGWTLWAVQLAEVLKKALIDRRNREKMGGKTRRFIDKLFRKIWPRKKKQEKREIN